VFRVGEQKAEGYAWRIRLLRLAGASSVNGWGDLQISSLRSGNPIPPGVHAMLRLRCFVLAILRSRVVCYVMKEQVKSNPSKVEPTKGHGTCFFFLLSF
jgi:hypothetical protein